MHAASPIRSPRKPTSPQRSPGTKSSSMNSARASSSTRAIWAPILRAGRRTAIRGASSATTARRTSCTTSIRKPFRLRDRSVEAHDRHPVRPLGGGILQMAFLEFPADAPVERIAPAAAEDVRQTHEKERERELGAARGPEITVRHLDAHRDDRELDGEHERHDARTEAQSEEDHAEEFKERHDPRPERRRIKARLQHVAAGDARDAVGKDFLITARQD